MKPRYILLATAAFLLIQTVRGVVATPKPDYPCSFRNEKNQLVSLQDAKRAREKAVRIGESTGVRLNTVTRYDAEETIRCVALAYGASPRDFVEVARCESGLRPDADENPPFVGLYQHHSAYWPARAATYGHKGASPYDGYSAINVTVQMVLAGGWSPWECKP